MKVKMLKTRKGSFDPYRFFCFKEGGIFNVPNMLALAYIKQGVAEQVVEEEKPAKRKKKKVI